MLSARVEGLHRDLTVTVVYRFPGPAGSRLWAAFADQRCKQTRDAAALFGGDFDPHVTDALAPVWERLDLIP
eukprot:2647017-Alexandrium_andersonii.AAC.1